MDNKNKEPIYITQPLTPPLKAVNERLKEIWDSKWLTNMGKQHNSLEKLLKKYLDVNNITLFSNGTLALLLGIKSLNLHGEVITTPFTFPATVECLDWNNIDPIFCDIKPSTGVIDEERIESLITPKTSAILGVHVYGNLCNIEKIDKIAKKHNLKVIYDAAHAFGSIYKNKGIGNYGDLSMFSFHATKLFHSVEGGALTFNDPNLSFKLNLLKNFGIKGPETVLLSGINAKMNELQAAIGIEVLKMVNIERKKRKAIREHYISNLKNVPGITILTKKLNEFDSFQYFVIRINGEKFGKSRDDVYKILKNHNIFSRKYFYPLCSTFGWYKNNSSAKAENIPNALLLADEVLALPFYGDLDLHIVDEICDLISISSI